MNEKTRRELLEAAFEEKPEGETDEKAAASVEEQIPVSAETDTPAESQDAYEVEAKAAKDESATPKEEKPAEAPKQQELPLENQQAQQPTDDAPISWRSEEKAHWAKVPNEVKAIIQRRELEVQRALSSSSQARKFAGEFQQVVAPFAHLIRAQNSHPLQAVHNLMSTAAGLMTGNAQQKAAIVAEIVSNYGVDIQALDTALSQAPQNPNAGQASLPPQFAQALQPVYQFMERIENSRKTFEERQAEKTAEEVSRFGQNRPFFNEVREDMADIIEAAAARGRTLTLEQAYNAAIAANPEYASAVQQRKEAESISQAAATLARARRASSTVKGGPTAENRGPKPAADRRSAIAQAWDEAERG